MSEERYDVDLIGCFSALFIILVVLGCLGIGPCSEVWEEKDTPPVSVKEEKP